MIIKIRENSYINKELKLFIHSNCDTGIYAAYCAKYIGKCSEEKFENFLKKRGLFIHMYSYKKMARECDGKIRYSLKRNGELSVTISNDLLLR